MRLGATLAVGAARPARRVVAIPVMAWCIGALSACQIQNLEVISGVESPAPVDAGTPEDGELADGQLLDSWATGEFDPTLRPAQITSTVAGAYDHTCALAGTELYCWGKASHGRLGDGSTDGIFTEPVRVSSDRNWISVDLGADFSCALDDAGQVWCWGNNDRGQLGTDDFAARSTPTRVMEVSNAAQVTAGEDHACAVLFEGELLCWGDNAEGQLGIDGEGYSPEPRATPQLVPLGPILIARAGQGHTCAVQGDGIGWCWGRNTRMELGRDDIGPQVRQPTEIEGHTWIDLVAGQCHTSGLRRDGVVMGWGDNTFFQHGLGHARTPIGQTELSAGPFAQIVTDTFHTCTLDRSTQLRCFGRNEEGQLGLPYSLSETSPVLVPPPAGRRWRELGVGRMHTCARMHDDSVWCTGQNRTGAVGNGTTDNGVWVRTGQSSRDVTGRADLVGGPKQHLFWGRAVLSPVRPAINWGAWPQRESADSRAEPGLLRRVQLPQQIGGRASLGQETHGAVPPRAIAPSVCRERLRFGPGSEKPRGDPGRFAARRQAPPLPRHSGRGHAATRPAQGVRRSRREV